jgi:hypothetical protein
MTQKLINDARWHSLQALLEAAREDHAYTDWHPVFGIL